MFCAVKVKNEKSFFDFHFSLFEKLFSRENRKIVFSGWLLQSAVREVGKPLLLVPGCGAGRKGARRLDRLTVPERTNSSFRG